MSELIFSGAKNSAPQRSLALPLCRNPLYAVDTSTPHAHMTSMMAIIIMSYYSLRLDAQSLTPVRLCIISCWRHCLALQKPPLAPRNSYWRCFRRHSARLTPLVEDEDVVEYAVVSCLCSIHSHSQLSPALSHILWSTTRDKTTLGTLFKSHSSLFSRHRHLPFSRPNAFSTTILALL